MVPNLNMFPIEWEYGGHFDEFVQEVEVFVGLFLVGKVLDGCVGVGTDG